MEEGHDSSKMQASRFEGGGGIEKAILLKAKFCTKLKEGGGGEVEGFKFLKLSQATTIYCITMRLLTRAHLCKQPALVTTTFSDFRGHRLQEL